MDEMLSEGGLVTIILVSIGLFTFAGGLFDWDWFMTQRRARLVVKVVGRTGARVFYILLGIGIAIFAIFFI
jgi:hypothetical protein